MNKIFRTVFFIIVLLVGQTQWVSASTDTDRLDLRIVLDISQHTRVLLPRQNHLHALSVLIARLPDSARAGLWSYGRYVNHLVQHGPVDHQWRLQAIAAVSRIQSVAQYTNLAEALNQASYDRRTAKGRRHILLVASGNPEISDKPDVNMGQLQWVREQLLPELIKAGFVIHTLSVGREDTSLLQSLATQTGGLSLRLDSAESIDSLIERVADNVLQSTGQPQPLSNSVVKALPPPAREPEVKSVVGDDLAPVIAGSVNGGRQFAARLDAFAGLGVYQLYTIKGGTQDHSNPDGAGQIIRRYALGVEKSHSDDVLQYNIRVLLDETGLRSDQSSLIARVARRGPENSASERASAEPQIRTASKIGDGQWLLQLEDDGVSSYYEVDFDMGGVSLEGGNEQYRTKPLLIELERREVSGVEVAVNADVSEIAAFAEVEAAPGRAVMSKFVPRENVNRQGYERAIKTLAVAVVAVLIIVGFLLVWRRFKGRARPQASGTIAPQELEISQTGPGAVVDGDCSDPELKTEPKAVSVILPVVINEEQIENLFEAPPDIEAMDNGSDLEEGLELAAEWDQLDIEPTKSAGETGFHVPDKNYQTPGSDH